MTELERGLKALEAGTNEFNEWEARECKSTQELWDLLKIAGDKHGRHDWPCVFARIEPRIAKDKDKALIRDIVSNMNQDAKSLDGAFDRFQTIFESYKGLCSRLVGVIESIVSHPDIVRLPSVIIALSAFSSWGKNQQLRSLANDSLRQVMSDAIAALLHDQFKTSGIGGFASVLAGLRRFARRWDMMMDPLNIYRKVHLLSGSKDEFRVKQYNSMVMLCNDRFPDVSPDLSKWCCSVANVESVIERVEMNLFNILT